MKFYQEITLLPSSDISLGFLWGKVFKQVHLGIVEQLDENGNSTIGISFPEYNKNKKIGIGEKFRLLSINSDNLENLNIKKWLARLSDYVHMTSIRPVPRNIEGHTLYQRERFKSNSHMRRLAVRKAKREGISVEEARGQFGEFQKKDSKNPFINMYSETTGQKFKLFILRKEVDSATGDGTFGSYGLGAKSSVPEF